jgi:hypothetical protein
MEARFSASVYPGDELTISMWHTADGEAVFTPSTNTGATAITEGRCTFRA